VIARDVIHAGVLDVALYVAMPLLVHFDGPVVSQSRGPRRGRFDTRAGALLDPRSSGLWCGTSVMLFGSLAALAVQWRTLVRSFNIFQQRQAGSVEAELAAVEIPLRWSSSAWCRSGSG
jgi:hypothetical protein